MKKIILGVGAVLLLLFLTRFALAPVVDLTIDDWFVLASVSDKNFGQVFRMAALDVYRPVSMIMGYVTTKIIGDSAIGYAVIKSAGAVALTLAVMAWAFAGTQNYGSALLAGSLFSVLPITHEPYGYAMQSLLLISQFFLVASLFFWERYVRTGETGYSLSSIILFLPIAGSEFGVFTSPYFVIRALLAGAGRKSYGAGVVFIGLAMIYLAWRFTHAFGFGHYAMIDSRYLGTSDLTVMTILQNIRRIGSWWFGGLLLDTVSAGWISFRQLIPKLQIALVVSIVGTLALLVTIIRTSSSQSLGRSASRGFLWSLLLLAALSYSPFLIFPAVPRHNIYPAAALCIIAAHFVLRSNSRERLIVVALMIGMLGLSAAGLSKNWRDAGRYHRNSFLYLHEHKDAWSQMDYMLVDTAMLRERMTAGLHKPAREWAFHGQANMPRAWVYSSMMHLIHPARYPQVILDAESGAYWRDGTLYWHRRFDPGTTYEASGTSVYILNSYAAGSDVDQSDNKLQR